MPKIPPKHIEKPKNVLVLCHGNICRSPLVGVVLEAVLGSERIRTRACKSYESGKAPPAAKKVREYAQGLGYDLNQHRAKTVLSEDLEWADLILYMDRGNRERMGEFMTSSDWEKARCLGEYLGVESIPDPNFVPRGERLRELLDLAVRAAEACAEDLTKKPPDHLRGYCDEERSEA